MEITRNTAEYAEPKRGSEDCQEAVARRSRLGNYRGYKVRGDRCRKFGMIPLNLSLISIGVMVLAS